MNKTNKKELITDISKFIIPFIIGFATIGFTGYFIAAPKTAEFWGLISAYFFPPLGKESVIPTGIAVFGFDPLLMALSVAFIDIIIALFLVWNFDLAKKIPIVGKFIIKVETIGERSSDKYGWVRPLRFIGIILFVMVPFQGSGGLVGSIVGRLIGMKPENTFFAISIGAIIGCTLIAYSTDLILGVFAQNFLFGLFIFIIIVIIGIMIFVYRRNSIRNSKK